PTLAHRWLAFLPIHPLNEAVEGRDTDARSTRHQTRPVAPGGARSVVLVVDDEPAIRLLCRVNLELAGYEVREAATLADARRQLEGVSVVLLDMHVGAARGETPLAERQERGTP